MPAATSATDGDRGSRFTNSSPPSDSTRTSGRRNSSGSKSSSSAKRASPARRRRGRCSSARASSRSARGRRRGASRIGGTVGRRSSDGSRRASSGAARIRGLRRQVNRAVPRTGSLATCPHRTDTPRSARRKSRAWTGARLRRKRARASCHSERPSAAAPNPESAIALTVRRPKSGATPGTSSKRSRMTWNTAHSVPPRWGMAPDEWRLDAVRATWMIRLHGCDTIRSHTSHVRSWISTSKPEYALLHPLAPQ